MGSLRDTNLLSYLRSRTQVDVDTLDIDVITRLGPFDDCTSNQAEAYTELLNPRHAALLKKSAALGKEFMRGVTANFEFKNVTETELALEIAMVCLGLIVVPHIKGRIHIMANPVYAYDERKVIENALRLAYLCKRLEPNFDSSRLVIKVSCTWEGMQACRKLKEMGVQTLATTIFSMPQVVLAGEVGVKSISPFCHEFRAHIDENHHDPEPLMKLNVQAQNYFEQYSIPTRVKACATLAIDETLQLAGVAELTIMTGQLDELAKTAKPVQEVQEMSLFNVKANPMEKETYIDDEAKYREAFAAYSDGLGKAKTKDCIDCFVDYQRKAEALLSDPELTVIG